MTIPIRITLTTVASIIIVILSICTTFRRKKVKQKYVEHVEENGRFLVTGHSIPQYEKEHIFIITIVAIVLLLTLSLFYGFPFDLFAKQ